MHLKANPDLAAGTMTFAAVDEGDERAVVHCVSHGYGASIGLPGMGGRSLIVSLSNEEIAALALVCTAVVVERGKADDADGDDAAMARQLYGEWQILRAFGVVADPSAVA